MKLTIDEDFLIYLLGVYPTVSKLEFTEYFLCVTQFPTKHRSI